MTGLIKMPTARMMEDGKIVIGASLIPKPYFKSTAGYNFLQNRASGLPTYITYGLLPFVEIMFRYTNELGAKVNPSSRYFPDRMLGLRIRLIQESKMIPSIVIGFQDISAFIGNTCLNCTFFSATYLVTSKKFDLNHFSIDLTIGNSIKINNDLLQHDFLGLFTGLNFTLKYFNKFSLIADFNQESFNSGIIFRHRKFNLMGGIWDFNKPTFSFNYFIN